MRRLAYNGEACLVAVNREYWIITKEWEMKPLSEQRPDYKATNALHFFTEWFGQPTWVRDQIETL